MKRRARRLYAYSDETGQDSRGDFFIVVTIIIDGDRDEIVAWLEEAEEGNRQLRGVSTEKRRLAFIDKVLGSHHFRDSIFFSEHKGTVAYRDCTITSIRRALETKAPERDYEADIIVDGLTKPERRLFAKELRQKGVPIHRVRGARDESDAVTRLADKIATLVRGAKKGDRECQTRLERSRRIQEV